MAESEHEMIEDGNLRTFKCKICQDQKSTLNDTVPLICEGCEEALSDEENLSTIRKILGKAKESINDNTRIVKKIDAKFLNSEFKNDANNIKRQRLEHELTFDLLCMILNCYEFIRGSEGDNGEGIVQLLNYFGVGKDHVEGIEIFLQETRERTSGINKVAIADHISKRKRHGGWISLIFDLDGENKKASKPRLDASPEHKNDENRRDLSNEPIEKEINNIFTSKCYRSDQRDDAFDDVIMLIDEGDQKYAQEFKNVLEAIMKKDYDTIRSVIKIMREKDQVEGHRHAFQAMFRFIKCTRECFR